MELVSSRLRLQLGEEKARVEIEATNGTGMRGGAGETMTGGGIDLDPETEGATIDVMGTVEGRRDMAAAIEAVRIAAMKTGEVATTTRQAKGEMAKVEMIEMAVMVDIPTRTDMGVATTEGTTIEDGVQLRIHLDGPKIGRGLQDEETEEGQTAKIALEIDRTEVSLETTETWASEMTGGILSLTGDGLITEVVHRVMDGDMIARVLGMRQRSGLFELLSQIFPTTWTRES